MPPLGHLNPNTSPQDPAQPALPAAVKFPAKHGKPLLIPNASTYSRSHSSWIFVTSEFLITVAVHAIDGSFNLIDKFYYFVELALSAMRVRTMMHLLTLGRRWLSWESELFNGFYSQSFAQGHYRLQQGPYIDVICRCAAWLHTLTALVTPGLFELLRCYPEGSQIFTCPIYTAHGPEDLISAGIKGVAGNVRTQGTACPEIVVFNNIFTIPNSIKLTLCMRTLGTLVDQQSARLSSTIKTVTMMKAVHAATHMSYGSCSLCTHIEMHKPALHAQDQSRMESHVSPSWMECSDKTQSLMEFVCGLLNMNFTSPAWPPDCHGNNQSHAKWLFLRLQAIFNIG